MQVFQSMLMASVALVAATTLQADSTDAETEVTVQEDVLIYTGPLSQDANTRAAALLKQFPQVQTLKITSQGGEIGLGMDLGDQVYAHQLNVEVGQYCFFFLRQLCVSGRKDQISELAQSAGLAWRRHATNAV
ncbi:hypothetical protein [Acinetobacter indicus]|uniref:hypothetical protein n=2 Tax=Acinetobacter indicus TaxID=756892 RepID=UPI001443D7D0|nr:hypothetical protein [Acinetobacter indicus]